MASPILMLAALNGCGEAKQIPVVDLRPWKPISTSCADTPETRTQVVAHNSVLDSLKSGRKVVYADPCPKAAPVVKPPPTS